uniref:Uncharacterized protein n=1 Tax=Alectorobius mimon TaxID=360319 RepID=A0A147B9Q0_9ACAR
MLWGVQYVCPSCYTDHLSSFLTRQLFFLTTSPLSWPGLSQSGCCIVFIQTFLAPCWQVARCIYLFPLPRFSRVACHKLCQ